MPMSPTQIAHARGYKTGLDNHHCSDRIYTTSAEWAAWLAGWRKGWAVYKATQTWALPQIPRKPNLSDRRAVHFERKSA